MEAARPSIPRLLRKSRGQKLPPVIKNGKPPEEWTLEEITEEERRLTEACRRCAELKHAKELRCGRRAAATRLKQALAILHTPHAASILLAAVQLADAIPWGYG
jgi:hypothetical protein